MSEVQKGNSPLLRRAACHSAQTWLARIQVAIQPVLAQHQQTAKRPQTNEHKRRNGVAVRVALAAEALQEKLDSLRHEWE